MESTLTTVFMSEKKFHSQDQQTNSTAHIIRKLSMSMINSKVWLEHANGVRINLVGWLVSSLLHYKCLTMS